MGVSGPRGGPLSGYDRVVAVAEAPGLPGLVLLQHARIAEVDFARAAFDRLAPSGCVFVDCDFRQATLDRRLQPLFTAHERNVFRGCRFDGTDLRHIDPGTSRFDACSFEGANLDRWSAQTSEFVDCRFAGRVAHVRFYGKPWGPAAGALEPKRGVNEFHGNDFSRAELIDVTFVMGIDVNKQRWPECGDYVRLDRIHQRLTRGRTALLALKDLEVRSEALQMVQALGFLYMQQNDVVARRVEPDLATPADVQRRVWDTLAAAL